MHDLLNVSQLVARNYSHGVSRRAFTCAAACAVGVVLVGGRPVLALAGEGAPGAQQYVAGTYAGVSVGNGGDIVVEVTFSQDAIESIAVVQQSETPAVASGVLEQLPQMIIDAQSLGIDTMTGATISSAGLMNAVGDAAKQAGADLSMLYKTVEVEPSNETIELTCDACVVGGGAAGMAAAIRLAELGQNVVLLEKTYRLGGSISVSGGNQVVMGSDLQVQAGVTEDTPEQMVEDFQKNGEGICVPELIELYAQNVGETTDWLNQSCGVEFNMEAGLHDLAEYTYDRELAYTGGGAGCSAAMQETISSLANIKVLTDARARRLLTDSGCVAGVEAEAKDGATYLVSSSAVVLATGGYGNADAWLTPELAEDALYYGLTTSTGDGLTMATAEDVDAATLMLEYAKQYPNGVEVSEGRAKSTIDGNLVVWPMSAILVNPEGERVVNEKASNHEILEVELAQTNSMLYLLMDAANYEAWSAKLPGMGFNMDSVAAWLEANGATTPVFAHGDTIEELAGRVGIDPAVLVKTVVDYNAGVAAGADEFGRSGDYLKMEIGEGPYYLIEQKPRYATTMGGLVVDGLLQVQGNDGLAIEGLYAAGEVVGGVMGSNSPSGANNGWALTSGKLAAETIAG